jgi:tetratricopeptide (TPR) repeat protein
VTLPDIYAVHFAELDELYEAAGTRPKKRLAVMEKAQDTVIHRDDATQRLIALKVLGRKYTEAIALMTDREFEIWEGGSLTVVNDWISAHLLRGQDALGAQDFQQALDNFIKAPQIPKNLPSADHSGGRRRAECAYWTGRAHEALGHRDKAQAIWTEAVSLQKTSSPPPRGRRNGLNAEAYFLGLIHQGLGQPDQATPQFEQLLETAQAQLKDAPELNASATARDQRSQRDRLANAHALMGLAYRGLADAQRAKASLAKALEIQPGLLMARTTLNAMP